MVGILCVHVSPNNRARCRDCDAKILKGEPRMEVQSHYNYGGYLCYKCADKTINEVFVEIRAYKKKFLELKKKCINKIIIKELFR